MDEDVCRGVIDYIKQNWMVDSWLPALADGRVHSAHFWGTPGLHTSNKSERALRSIHDDALDRLVCLMHWVVWLPVTELTAIHLTTATADLMKLWDHRAANNVKQNLQEVRMPKDAKRRVLDGRVLFLLTRKQRTASAGIYYVSGVTVEADDTQKEDVIGECKCKDYVWLESLYGKCKHVQVARFQLIEKRRKPVSLGISVIKREFTNCKPTRSSTTRKSSAPTVKHTMYSHWHPSQAEYDPEYRAPLYQKRPWRRINTVDSHPPRIPSRTQQVKGAKPRRPSKLTPANYRHLEPPEMDEIGCI
uniref:Uncharacterized protein n=1 Tax=Branchiostoma floridae TaxID=7739 RepID=C3ZJZ2_BRAFL|eukprot:XP_002591148.1 hypothetical protein BRAFLDRAFT_108911 [Branchiostoma floridae]